MTVPSGFTGPEDIVAETQFYAKASLDTKNPTGFGIKDASSTEGGFTERSEPKTSRWELWSWYGYAFGNNSAGTLSYAPLSMTLAIVIE